MVDLFIRNRKQRRRQLQKVKLHHQQLLHTKLSQLRETSEHRLNSLVEERRQSLTSTLRQLDERVKDWKACYKRFDEQLHEFAGEITSMDRRIELLSREEGLGGIGNDVLVQFRSDVEKVMNEVLSSYTHKIKSVDKMSSTDTGVG